MNRVFIISPTESHLTNRGKRHPDLANFLHENFYDVIYISSNFNHALKKVISKKEIEDQTVKYSTFFIKNSKYQKNISLKRIYWNLTFSLKLFFFIKRFNLNKHDIIIIPSRPPELIYFASLIKKKYNCKTILDIRDVWPDCFITKGLIGLGFKFYCNFYQRTSVKTFDKYIHVAPSFKNWLNRYQVSTNSSFIPLGIDKRFNEIEKNINNSDLNLIYGGALSYQCDITNIINAITSLEVNFLIFGDDGSGSNYQKIKSLSKKNKRITIFNIVQQNKVVDMYAKSDIAVIYMISGALPNKFFDAIGSLTPILAVGNGDVADMVKKYDLGWCIDNNVEKIKNCLINISKNAIEQKVINIKKIKNKFMRQNLLKEYLNIVQNI